MLSISNKKAACLNMLWPATAGDMGSLSCEVKRDLCQALAEQTGGWENLARALGLGILTSAFRLSSCPAGKLLDSYEVNTKITLIFPKCTYCVL